MATRYCELVLPVDFKSCLKNKNNLTAFHLNARSLQNKSDDIGTFFSEIETKFDIIMFTETWGTEDCDALSLPGYTCNFLNRIGRRGGGVSMYIKEHLKCDVINMFTEVTSDYEVLTLSYKTKLLSVIYRPPASDFAKFLLFVDKLFEFVNVNNYTLILGGDLNTDMSQISSNRDDFNNTLTSNGFHNIIISPTRITASTSSVIDLFITNTYADVDVAGTISFDVSDHLPIFMSLPVNNVTSKRRKIQIVFQPIYDASLQSFRNAIKETDWSVVYAKKSVNDSYNLFLEKFKSLYETHFPRKTITLSNKIRKPWVTPAFLKRISEKNKLYKAFISSRDPSQLSVFKKYRNKLSSDLKKAKLEYHNDLFDEDNKKSPEVIWRSINKVLNRKTGNSNLDELKINDTVFAGTALADYFNHHFVNFTPGVYNPSAASGISKLVTESLFLDATSEPEVIGIFMRLKNSKSCDINNIQIKPVKYVIDLIAPFLVYIFNKALEQGEFPSSMKNAKVSVLHKGGDKNEISNYRPISVLPIFSKGLEKLIACRLEHFLLKHSVITDAQFGFRKGKSTESALLLQKEIIVQNIENKLLTLGIFIDFSKAFDCLNHTTLLDKLSCYGMRGVSSSLLQSYLENRKQSVIIDGHLSSPQDIKCGVPQGSILGPLLFNIYINDIVNLNHDVRYIIYADDTSVLLTSSSVDELVVKANNFLSAFSKWSSVNGLLINIKKTKGVLFHPINKPVNAMNDIMINGHSIELVNEHKTLGVIFSQNLTWDSQVNLLINKLNKVVGALSRCRTILPVSIKLQIYYSLFNSYINYCHLVWGNTTKSNLNKIFILQKKMLRCIANVDYFSHTKPLFKQYNIINVADIYDYRLIYSFRFSCDAHHSFLLNTSELSRRSTSVHTRHSYTWNIPRCRTNYGLQSLKHSLPFLLNKYHHIDVLQLRKKELRLLFL